MTVINSNERSHRLLSPGRDQRDPTPALNEVIDLFITSGQGRSLWRFRFPTKSELCLMALTSPISQLSCLAARRRAYPFGWAVKVTASSSVLGNAHSRRRTHDAIRGFRSPSSISTTRMRRPSFVAVWSSAVRVSRARGESGARNRDREGAIHQAPL